MILRGADGIAQVPDPTSQGPSAGALTVAAHFWRCQWFEEST